MPKTTIYGLKTLNEEVDNVGSRSAHAQSRASLVSKHCTITYEMNTINDTKLNFTINMEDPLYFPFKVFPKCNILDPQQ